MKIKLAFPIENIRASFLVAEKIYRSLISIILASLIARTYGPAEYGLLAFITTNLALASIFLSLGLEGPLLRQLSLKDRINHLNSFLEIKIAACLFATLISLMCWPLIQPSEHFLYLLLLLYIPFTCLELFEVELLSNNQQMSLAKIKIFCCSFIAIVKAVIIFHQLPLNLLLITYAAEPCITNACIFMLAKKNRNRKLISLPFLSSFKSIITESMPLWVSALGIAAYTRVDQIIIARSLGEQQLGIYVAATQIISFFNFIPVALYNSHAASFLSLQKNNEKISNEKFVALFIKFNKAALASSIFILLCADSIINLAYGEKFQASALILKTLTISNFFVFMGVAHSLWILSNQKPLVRLYGTIATAILSITLNLLLTPHFGLVSAAIVASLAQSFAAFFANYIWAKESFILQIKSLGIK
ncbi:oligosaccharide flippase family protein [Chitinibacter sp. SCUT-21]|uniref:oligosaccharide flippase family protein n=1 Tax=Chitinibacter sp. SCUT-21 TaxID=2970891 RepID=UPI0035A6A81B